MRIPKVINCTTTQFLLLFDELAYIHEMSGIIRSAEKNMY